MDAETAYQEWLAIGQNYELDRFAVTRVAFMAGRASLPTGEPKTLTDEQIDRIAENCAKSMDGGIQGFCKTWGWRQFARELLDICAGYERTGDAGEPVAPMQLSVIRKWPDGFEARLQHVWLDVVSFIPDVKLWDLQRTLAEFGFRMEVYESGAATPSQGADALDDEQIRAVAKRIKMPKIFWDTQNFREWLGKFHAAASTEGEKP